MTYIALKKPEARAVIEGGILSLSRVWADQIVVRDNIVSAGPGYGARFMESESVYIVATNDADSQTDSNAVGQACISGTIEDAKTYLAEKKARDIIKACPTTASKILRLRELLSAAWAKTAKTLFYEQAAILTAHVSLQEDVFAWQNQVEGVWQCQTRLPDMQGPNLFCETLADFTIDEIAHRLADDIAACELKIPS